jgi:WD40 repeat protein
MSEEILPSPPLGRQAEEDLWSIDSVTDLPPSKPEKPTKRSRPWKWLVATALLAGPIGGFLWLDRQQRIEDETLRQLAESQASNFGLEVQALAFSANGRTIAGGSADGTVRLWDATTGKERGVLEGHGGGLSALAFAPNGEKLVAACADWERKWGEAIVWDVATGVRRSLDVDDKPITALAFAKSGRVMATSDVSGTLTIWDTETWHSLDTFDNHDEVLALAFSYDGQLLAAASPSGRLRLWNLRTGYSRSLRRFRESNIRFIAFAPDGRTLATTTPDGVVRLWDVPSASLRQTYQVVPNYEPIRAVAFSPDSRRLAFSVGFFRKPGQLYLWKVEGNAQPAVLVGHTEMIFSVAFAPDGQTIAGGGRDQTVCLWNAADGTELSAMQAESHAHASPLSF